MIFRVSTWLSIALLCGLCACLVWKLGLINEGDRETYRELISVSNLKSENSAKKEPYKASQLRRDVVKEFFIKEGSERHLLRLESAKSALYYAESETQKELIEQMEDLVCLMQEELYYLKPDGHKVLKSAVTGEMHDLIPMQVIRRLEADSAELFYRTEEVSAQNVKVERYTLLGHILEDPKEKGKLMMKGKAQNVTFSLAGRGLNFHAEHLTATVN